MRNIVVGTAGHIDHGKTALIRALTGIDTDRLEEEKRRGISIDLGFAHMDLGPDLRVGFVDVPGHERFVKNMLAGAAGVDLVLLVIAADESIKPQTREHFDICRLLGVREGIIVLTKADLVEPGWLDLVRVEVEEFVRGSFLEGAPVVAVSSKTGEGLDRLREVIRLVSQRLPEKDSGRHFRLPIDRAFTMKGFGTVVTGTLISGSVRENQDLELHPERRRVRVRGVQVHGVPVEAAVAGQRTALNLTGIDAKEIQRGMVLTTPETFRSTTVVDARLSLLASAKPLKHRAPVHFHAGTAELTAEARLLEGSSSLAPGAEALVRFLLAKPTLLLPGDRFIIRMFSPVVTIGGGVVLDIDPPQVKRPVERLRVLAMGRRDDAVRLLVRESRYGCSVRELVARTGWTEEEIRSAHGVVRLPAGGDWLVDPAWVDLRRSQILDVLRAFHQQFPLLEGMPKEDLRARVLPDGPPFLLDALLADWTAVMVAGDKVKLAGHRVAFREEEDLAWRRLEATFERAGLAPPPVNEALAGCGLDIVRARQLFEMLLRNRRLVRISHDLVMHATAIEQVKQILAQKHGQKFSVPAFKEWTGISRKYAIPLLEFLDREKITRREGDMRVILGKP